MKKAYNTICFDVDEGGKGNEENNLQNDLGDVLDALEGSVQIDSNEGETPKGDSKKPSGDLDDSDGDDLDSGDSGESDDDLDEGEGAKSAEVISLETKIAALEDNINQLTASINKGQTSDSEEAAEFTWNDEELVPEDFDPDTLTREQLNGMLNKAASIGAASAVEFAVKESMRQIPVMVRNNVDRQVAITKAVDDFYNKNKDLVKHKLEVSQVATRLASKNPDWTLTKLFEESGKEARKILAIATPKKRTPGLTDVNNQNRTPDGQLQGLSAEIDQMMKIS
jgi:hypothetical protein